VSWHEDSSYIFEHEIFFCVHTKDKRISALINATADLPAFTLAGTTRQAKVVSCYDGDTFEAAMILGDTLWKFDCRMCGYDSPEIKPLKSAPNRDAEKTAALRSKIALMSHICDGIEPTRPYTNKELNDLVKTNKKIIELDCKEFDKYGRVLVEIKHSDGDVGSTVNEWMIANHYGYAYTGGTKKTFS
jgi:endonuclease YncB( thermonuclease family)